MYQYIILVLLTLAGLIVGYMLLDVNPIHWPVATNPVSAHAPGQMVGAGDVQVDTLSGLATSDKDAVTNDLAGTVGGAEYASGAAANNAKDQSLIRSRDDHAIVSGPEGITENNKSRPKPHSQNISDSALNVINSLFPPGSDENRKAHEKYQRLLNQDPTLQSVFDAKEGDWADIVHKVRSGELDPNKVVGGEVMRYLDELGVLLEQRRLDSMTDEQRKSAGQARKMMASLAERLPQTKPNTLFDKILRSPNATAVDIQSLINYNAKINDDLMVNLILAPIKEELKLERVRLLIQNGAAISGSISGDTMSPFEAAMVRGETGVGDYLISQGANPDINAANTAIFSNDDSYTTEIINYLEQLGLSAEQTWIDFKEKLGSIASKP